HPENMAELAGMIKGRCQTLGFTDVVPLQYTQFAATDVSGALSKQKIDLVFFLGSGKELEEMLASAVDLNWGPTVFQPGPLARQDVMGIPPAFEERVFLSFPTLPTDLDPDAISEYRALAAKHKLNAAQPALLLAVLASAKVLLEGLRTSGRQLDRDKF